MRTVRISKMSFLVKQGLRVKRKAKPLSGKDKTNYGFRIFDLARDYLREGFFERDFFDAKNFIIVQILL